MESIESLDEEMILQNFSLNLEDDIEKEEFKKILFDVIKNLSERDRLFLTLRYYQDMNIKEISFILGISVSYAYKIHQSIVKKIKLAFSKMEKVGGQNVEDIKV